MAPDESLAASGRCRSATLVTWRKQYSLAQWGEAQAGRYLDELEEGFRRLARNPELGHANKFRLVPIITTPMIPSAACGWSASSFPASSKIRFDVPICRVPLVRNSIVRNQSHPLLLCRDEQKFVGFVAATDALGDRTRIPAQLRWRKR